MRDEIKYVWLDEDGEQVSPRAREVLGGAEIHRRLAEALRTPLSEPVRQ
jgi:hypothetical protein